MGRRQTTNQRAGFTQQGTACGRESNTQAHRSLPGTFVRRPKTWLQGRTPHGGMRVNAGPGATAVPRLHTHSELQHVPRTRSPTLRRLYLYSHADRHTRVMHQQRRLHTRPRGRATGKHVQWQRRRHGCSLNGLRVKRWSANAKRGHCLLLWRDNGELGLGRRRDRVLLREEATTQRVLRSHEHGTLCQQAV